MLGGAETGAMYLGVAKGIESYPWSLRSCSFEESKIKSYPQLEMGLDIAHRLFFTSTFSYRNYQVSMFDCFCTQRIELTLTCLSLDYALQQGAGRFALGTGVLVGFSTLDHVGAREHHAGLGICLYGIAVQPLYKNFFWGVRTGVRRLRVRLSEHREFFNLDTFSVELIMYLSS